MPIDDMGPEREVTHPQVFDLLCRDFTDSGYDTRRLFEIIRSEEHSLNSRHSAILYAVFCLNKKTSRLGLPYPHTSTLP